MKLSLLKAIELLCVSIQLHTFPMIEAKIEIIRTLIAEFVYSVSFKRQKLNKNEDEKENERELKQIHARKRAVREHVC